MNGELNLLLATAASIGFFHTLLGPDHYLPFIVMAKSGSWSMRKTLFITFLCGVGHVLGSVVLGFLGLALGVAIFRLEAIESVRGDVAAWGLIAFGLVYMVWGIRQAWKNRPHIHLHTHEDGSVHQHSHVHQNEHSHLHAEADRPSMRPWILFIVFVLGPCEPLIPLLMYPAAQNSIAGVISVTLIFSLTTIGTMLTIVAVSSYGLALAPLKTMERYVHALAGAAILSCGLAIRFLGL